MHKNHLIDKKLSYRVIHDCFILPHGLTDEYGLFDSGLFDSNGNYIYGRFQKSEHDGVTNLSSISSRCNLNLDDIEYKKTTSIYLGMLWSIWGHFITDSMKYLWFTRSKYYSENFSQCGLAYFSDIYFKFSGSYKRMYEILGINIPLLEPVTKLTKYETIILPDECFFADEEGMRFFSREYAEIIDGVRNYAIANAKPVKAKKFYFSYSRYHRDKSVGEDKLEKYFKSKGYEIIYPEKLSLDEQLNIFANCESFASTVGSCSHNIIFLRDNTEVILIPRAYYITSYQLALDHVHNLNINYVDSSLSVFTGKIPWEGPFLFFVSRNLRKFFHDEDTQNIINGSDFKKYLRSSFGVKLGLYFGRVAGADDPEVYKYYSYAAAEYFAYIFSSGWAKKFRTILTSAASVKNFLRKLRKTFTFYILC